MAPADSFTKAIDDAVREGDVSRRQELSAMAKLKMEQRLDWLSGRVQGLERDDLDILFGPEIVDAPEMKSAGRNGSWRLAVLLGAGVILSAAGMFGKDDFVASLERQNGGDIAAYCRNEGRVVKIVPGKGDVEMCVLKMKGGAGG